MQKLISSLKWLDNNILKILLVVFIFTIPLYPKKPLIDLEYTYISIRLEDFYIVLFIAVFAIQLLRKKVTLRKDHLLLFILFWVAVFLSFIYGVYIQKTLPILNIAFLHAARRVEYMVIFFIALSTVHSKKDFYMYLKFIVLALLTVSLYGLGQKFLGFPAIQTMNPEFALGRVLYLTPEARISSTFGGHYDLAAYLVFLLPILLGIYLWKKKIIYLIIYLVGLFALTLTASRISTISYLLSIIALLVFVRKWKLLIFIFVISIGLSFVSNNLIARFLKTFQVKQIFINEKTGQIVVPQRRSAKELPAGTFYVEIKDKNNSGSTEVTSNNRSLLRETILDDLRDQARKEGRTLTATEEADLAATVAADLKPVNTVVSDISLATRLQVEWPRAFGAFLKNPLFGTGPSSITEATDNDYLRWIGELGALGAGLFLLILFSISKKIWSAVQEIKNSDKLPYIGFLFGLFGLMLNASYIDVFEASKVAFYFWMISGIVIGSLHFYKKSD